ncbi:MAG: transketolase C-terminal domain-containing protein, partial [Bdellovibrionota bacterium]
RAVLIDESWKTGSLAGEIVALIAEKALYDLDSPPIRVCSREVPIPYSKHLQEATLPQVSAIVEAAKKAVNRA